MSAARSATAYYAMLNEHELHGFMLAKAARLDAAELCSWIRIRVRRTDFVDVHEGSAVFIAKGLRAVFNVETIASRLIELSRDSEARDTALRIGVSTFQSGRQLFKTTWAEAEAALQQTSTAAPYVVSLSTPSEAHDAGRYAPSPGNRVSHWAAINVS